jgi:hypothetical protein
VKVIGQSKAKKTKNKMNGIPSELAGAMGGRMLSHPMFDRNTPAASEAAAAAGASYADALINSRYAAAAQAQAQGAPSAASAAGGINSLLLQQELRRQENALGASGHSFAAGPSDALGSSMHSHNVYADALGASTHSHHGCALGTSTHSVHDTALLVRREKEEELLRLHEGHNRILQAEMAARAMRDRIAASSSSNNNNNSQAQAPQAAQPSPAQDDSFRTESLDRIVALQEQQALRQREIENLKQAELSEQSRLASQLSSPPVGVSDRDRLLASMSSAYGTGGGGHQLDSSSSHSIPPALRDEMAAVESMRLQQRRRLIEEETIKQEALKRQQEQRQATLNRLSISSRGEMVAADQEHLTRLRQLRGMSDQDLIERAAEVQNAQRHTFGHTLYSSYERNNSRAALERKIIAAQLAGLQRFQVGGGGASAGSSAGIRMDDQRNGLDMIDQAHADDLVSRRMSGMSSAHQQGQKSPCDLNLSQHSVNNNAMMNASQHSVAANNNNAMMNASQHSAASALPQPMKYFNNGIEVDMDGNPLHQAAAAAPQAAQGNNTNTAISSPLSRDTAMSPPASRRSITLVPTAQGGFQAAPGSETAALSNNTNTVNNNTINSGTGMNNNNVNGNGNNPSTSQGGDNNIISKFLTVVVSRVPELAPTVADLLPEGGDPAMLKLEFPKVVDVVLTELRSLQERYAGATDRIAADLLARVTNCITDIEPYKADLSMSMASNGGLGNRGLGPNVGSMAVGSMSNGMPTNGMPTNGMANGMSNNLTMEQMLMMQRQRAFAVMNSNSCQTLVPNNPMQYAAMAQQMGGAFTNSNTNNNNNNSAVTMDSHHELPPAFMEGIKSTSPAEDEMPMMAAYKSKKKKAKKAAKKKTKAKRRKSAPKLVHDSAVAKGIPVASPGPADQELKLEESPRKRSGSNSSSESAEPKAQDSPRKRSGSNSSAESSASRPMKKRRIFDKATVDENDTVVATANNCTSSSPENETANSDTPPAQWDSPATTTKGAKTGPHGALLDQLFGGSMKQLKAVDEEAPKVYVEDESKNQEDAVITDESGHTMASKGQDSDNESVHDKDDEEEDVHLGAANVLLGLMGSKKSSHARSA